MGQRFELMQWVFGSLFIPGDKMALPGASRSAKALLPSVQFHFPSRQTGAGSAAVHTDRLLVSCCGICSCQKN